MPYSLEYNTARTPPLAHFGHKFLDKPHFLLKISKSFNKTRILLLQTQLSYLRMPSNNNSTLVCNPINRLQKITYHRGYKRSIIQYFYWITRKQLRFKISFSNAAALTWETCFSGTRSTGIWWSRSEVSWSTSSPITTTRPVRRSRSSSSGIHFTSSFSVIISWTLCTTLTPAMPWSTALSQIQVNKFYLSKNGFYRLSSFL